MKNEKKITFKDEKLEKDTLEKKELEEKNLEGVSGGFYFISPEEMDWARRNPDAKRLN